MIVLESQVGSGVVEDPVEAVLDHIGVPRVREGAFIRAAFLEEIHQTTVDVCVVPIASPEG